MKIKPVNPILILVAFLFFQTNIFGQSLSAGSVGVDTGSTAFTVSGGQFSAPYYNFTDGNGQTPDFTTRALKSGKVYVFNASSASIHHPFMIGESYGDTNSTLVNGGPLTGSGGKITVTIPSDYNGSLYYFCTNHAGMNQEFTIQKSTHNADLNASVQLEMLWVEPGTFTMGSPTTETGRQANETEHNVSLTQGFYLGKYEVTQAQYEAVMTGNTAKVMALRPSKVFSSGFPVMAWTLVGLSATPSLHANNPNRPVERVSWDAAKIFLSRLNAQQSSNIPAGWAYVLPTESQWEYACRAGTSTANSWGNDINATHAHSLGQTGDVGRYAANPWGFFDMPGNAWEWTADLYGETYPTGNPVVDPAGDPVGEASGPRRVIRGGSWSSDHWVIVDGQHKLNRITDGASLRSAQRNYNTPSHRSGNLGFRVGFQKVQPDTESPELELLGGASITREAGQVWVEPGVSAQDTRDGYLASSVIVSGRVDVNSTGTYTLAYTVADAAGNEANTTRTVTVVDTTAPVLTVNGDQNVSHEAGLVYFDANATWSDFIDGSGSVTASGSMNINTLGSYVLSYNYTDSNGNVASSVTRTVTVVDTTNPVLTLLGDTNMTLVTGMTWVDPGASASDTLDGNLTGSVTVAGTVDLNTIGVYTITYFVSDGANNQLNATRVVNVEGLPVDTFTVSGGQFSAPYYNFTDGNGQTPDFTTRALKSGKVYVFNASSASIHHPFMIGESYGDTNSTLVNGGPLTGSGGKITVTIPSDYNGSLYYFCTNHAGMNQEFTIQKSTHNAAPSGITLSSASIEEDQPTGSELGIFSTKDVDLNSVHSYSLVSGNGSTDNSSFSLDPNGTLKTSLVFDFETKSTYSIRVRMSEQGGLSFEKVFTITVTDKTEKTTETVVLLLEGVSISAGWKEAGWFGFYYAQYYPWVYHVNLGWVHVTEDESNGAWLYRETLGWLWTNPNLFPYLFRNTNSNWLYLDTTFGPTRYYDYSVSNWVSIE